MRDDPLRSTIERLRNDLRRAVRLRLMGQAAGVVGCALWFWLALDRWWEPSIQTRALLLLTVSAAALGWLAFAALPMLLRRFDDATVLRLVARKRPDLGDVLLTANETRSADRSDETGLALAAQSRAARAAASLEGLRLTRDPRDSGWWGAAAIAWSATLLLAITAPRLFATLLDRITLSNEPWPRAVRLEPTGFVVDTPSGVWIKKVARGESVEAFVEAVTDRRRRLPTEAHGVFRRDGGFPVRSPLVRIGDPTLGGARQRFRFTTESIDRQLLATIRAGDAHARLRIVAVERPVIVDLVVRVAPPPYLGASPYTQPAALLRPAPEGARLSLTAQCNKRLAGVRASLRVGKEAPRQVSAPLTPDSSGFELDLPRLAESGEVVLDWTDADGVASENPFRLPIAIEPDRPPMVEIKRSSLLGALTPRGRLRLSFVARDDHSLATTKVTGAIDGEPVEGLVVTPSGKRETVADLVLDAETFGHGRLEPGAVLTLRGLAIDSYDLVEREPTVSESIEVEVVSPQELLLLLSEREQQLRRGLESTLSDARRLAYAIERLERGVAAPEGRFEARRLRAEVSGASDGFDAVLQAMRDNRIDQPRVLERIERGVVKPLRACAEQDLAPLEVSIAATDPPSRERARRSIQRAIDRIEQALSQTESDISYNRIVAQLRALIREQRKINLQTESAQGDRARALLLGPQE